MEHPIWHVLEHQGRTLAWLSRRTGYSQSRIWAVKGGEVASPEFRAKCAIALDIPEHLLFRPSAATAETPAA